MNPFWKLHAMRAFENEYLDSFTAEDYRLIGQIGYQQAEGKPLTLKQLFHSASDSLATVQRRLRRLKQRGFVRHRRMAADRREIQLTLTARCLAIFAKFDAVMTSGTALPGEQGEPRHACGLCGSDKSMRDLLVNHLVQGLQGEQHCLLMAPAETSGGILSELRRRRKMDGHLLVSDGKGSAEAQVEYLVRVAEDAARRGHTLCLAADMSWTLRKGLGIDEVLVIEARFDALSRKSAFAALCVYDSRRFSSDDFLRAAKCHHDHARHPIVLG